MKNVILNDWFFSYPIGFVLKKTHRHLGCQKGVMYWSRNTLKMLVNECNSQNKKKISWKIIWCDSVTHDKITFLTSMQFERINSNFIWNLWLLKRLQSHSVNNLLIVTCTYIFKCNISNNKYIFNIRPFRPIRYFKHIVNDEKKNSRASRGLKIYMHKYKDQRSE